MEKILKSFESKAESFPLNKKIRRYPFNWTSKYLFDKFLLLGYDVLTREKEIYPKLSELIEKIPLKIGKVLTWLLVAFMAVDAVVTSMALIRYDQRDNQVKAEQSWQVYMDEHYGDDVMQRIFPNAKNCDKN